MKVPCAVADCNMVSYCDRGVCLDDLPCSFHKYLDEFREQQVGKTLPDDFLCGHSEKLGCCLVNHQVFSVR